MKTIHPIILIAVMLSITAAACGGVTEAPPSQDQEPAAAPQSHPR